jgi:hypothetical protein
MRRVVIRVSAGPTWNGGPIREQPGWDEHAAFVDDLVDRGIFVMGGPFADDSGSLVLHENVDADESRRIMAGDPFVQNGVFVVEDVREWDVFVDELSNTSM